MSSLWTPSGEHPVDDRRRAGAPGGGPPGGAPPPGGPPGAPPGPGSDAERAEAAAAVDELRRQLVESPPDVVVANHAYGIFELAAIYLSQNPPMLEAAKLAIDAMGALVDGLAGRLGENEPSLREALAQVRLAYVQVEGAVRASAPGGTHDGGNGAGGNGGGPA